MLVVQEIRFVLFVVGVWKSYKGYYVEKFFQEVYIVWDSNRLSIVNICWDRNI